MLTSKNQCETLLSYVSSERLQLIFWIRKIGLIRIMLLFVFVVDQPDHENDHNCGVIRTESSGRWQNKDCSMALPYICKKRPNATLDPFTTGVCFYFLFHLLNQFPHIRKLPRYHATATDQRGQRLTCFIWGTYRQPPLFFKLLLMQRHVR